MLRQGRPSEAPLGTPSLPGPCGPELAWWQVWQSPEQHSLGLQQLGVGHALEPVGEQLEGAALGQQHKQAVEGLDQVWVVLHVQQLQAQICGRAEGRSGAWHYPTLHLSLARGGPARWPWLGARHGPLNSQTCLPLLHQCLALPMISLFFLPTYPPAHLSDLPNSYLRLATPSLPPGLVPPAPTLTASLVTRGLGPVVYQIPGSAPHVPALESYK